MGRVKREMKRIEGEKSRLLTFQMRRRGLTKKISELATLCGIDACMISFGPEGSRFSGPYLWPEDSQSMEIIFKKYFSVDKAEREKRMYRLSDFISSKDQEDNASSRNKNKEEEVIRDTESVSCDNSSDAAGGCGGPRALRELVAKVESCSSVKSLQRILCTLESRLDMVKDRIKIMKGEFFDLNQPSCWPADEDEEKDAIDEDEEEDATDEDEEDAMDEDEEEDATDEDEEDAMDEDGLLGYSDYGKSLMEGINENAGAEQNMNRHGESLSWNQQILSIVQEPCCSKAADVVPDDEDPATDHSQIHSKRGLRFRRSAGAVHLPQVLPSMMAFLPLDQGPSTTSAAVNDGVSTTGSRPIR